MSQLGRWVLIGLALGYGVAPAIAQDPLREQERTEQGLSEFLRGLADAQARERGRTPFVTDAEPPAIRLHRAADRVEVVSGEILRELHYWDSKVLLRAGDLVRSGPGARLLIEFPQQVHFRIFGPSQLRPRTGPIDSEVRLDFDILREFADMVVGEYPATLNLPGGNELSAKETRVTIRDFDRRALEVRNQGPSEVRVRGPYLSSEVLVSPGEMIYLPVLRVIGRPPPNATEYTMPMANVWASDGVKVAYVGSAIELASGGPWTGRASVAGTRLQLEAGASIRLRRTSLRPAGEE